MEAIGQTRLTRAVNGPILAIDIGGTHLRAAIFSPHMQIRRHAPTLAQEGADAVMSRLRQLVDEALENAGEPIVGVAVASAGQVDPQTGVVVDATDNLPGFRGLDLYSRIGQWFAPAPPPILIENDVNAALAAEATVYPDLSSIIVLALGTGVGGGLMIERRIIHGRHYFAGELGHMVLHPYGRPCNCGQHGCLEQYVSGPGLLLTTREHYPAAQTTHELFEALGQGKTWASDALDRFSEDLALALTSLVNLVDPDLIILAGGLATTHAHWEDRLARSAAQLSRKPIPLAYARFGDDSPLIGAVELFRQRYAVPFS